MPKDTGKVIVSLLAGATAGNVTGLLLAPENGDDLRKSLRESDSSPKMPSASLASHTPTPTPP